MAKTMKHRFTFMLDDESREKLIRLAAIRQLATGVDVSIAELAREAVEELLKNACKVEPLNTEE